jgi:hypothetical protein
MLTVLVLAMLSGDAGDFEGVGGAEMLVMLKMLIALVMLLVLV